MADTAMPAPAIPAPQAPQAPQAPKQPAQQAQHKPQLNWSHLNQNFQENQKKMQRHIY